ncbi:hypothetical protein BJ138DRAFT_1165332 [Hygrophoropsis aurantiaca]|uniref:Uncharacterized protein n=1 Tax=Hygrophoropsis aurantiaca TaxID=72124 RepID=A0ACB7ZW83_9AGAM|nr:hypothetical protein BJ138DRAFT_1165332 [Hygrophoropsis aurantiaca]
MAAVAILSFLGVCFCRRRSQPVVNPLAPRVSTDDSDDPDDPPTFPRTPAPLPQNSEGGNGISEAIAGRSQYTSAPEA